MKQHGLTWQKVMIVTTLYNAGFRGVELGVVEYEPSLNFFIGE